MSSDETKSTLIGLEEREGPPRRLVHAILTDSHFLAPLIVFCVGLTILIFLR